VGYTSEDYLKGRDPVLEAILNMSPADKVFPMMQQVYNNTGFRQAVWVYHRFALDPRTNPEEVGAVEKEFGDFLLQQKKAEEAAAWYGYMSSQHKEEVWPLIGIAQAHLLNKDSQKAKEVLEKAIRLEPANKQAKDLLAILRKGQPNG
jgi:Tfp pilus assembly protein PilF